MPEFVSPHPDIQYLGTSLQGMLRYLEGSDFPKDLLRSTLVYLGLSDVKPDTWYPFQAYLDLIRIVGARLGPEGIRAMGRSIPDIARFPPEIHTLERALKTLDVAYHLNHRGGPIGSYLYETIAPGLARLHCDNPYGCDFDSGILEALTRHFPGKGAPPTFRHLSQPTCRKKGGDRCVYQLEWDPP